MSSRLQVLVYENRQLVQSAEFDGKVELGRQRDRDEALFARKREDGRLRWVIARRDETTVGRNQLVLEPLADNRVRVINGSDKQPVRFADRGDLQPSAACDVDLPVLLILSPTKTLRVQRAAAVHVHSLVDITAPPRSNPPSTRLPSLLAPSGQVSTREMIVWLHSAMDVLQAAAGAADFFDRAAHAILDSVNLDCARVLLLKDDHWHVHATQTAAGSDTSALRPPSHSVLDRLRQEKRTTWEAPATDEGQPESLVGVDTVVAAPILDRDGEVIGALYGERRQRARPTMPPIGELEARLVELMARSVAAGLARVDEERKAVEATVQFEQFFTPSLARQLLNNPTLLDGTEREVTLLFCDIRGFSRITGVLKAARRTIEWCRDVLDALSECVLAEDGVLVDYTGDGLMALWGAPGDQPDHAARAARCALAMLDRLAGLNTRWQPVIGEPMSVGIGMNTGPVQVGNVGSRHKFKYGAHGNAVNLASRVEGTTKFFKCRVMLTGSTREKLDGTFLTRRLGRVKVVNIPDPVDLYQLLSPEWEHAARACQEYETALRQFDGGDFAGCVRTLGNWRSVCPADDPVLVLLYRAVEAMVKGKPGSHPVWELTEK